MISTPQEGATNQYDYFFRVLLLLSEHKISTAKFIDANCFSDASKSLVWKVLRKLRDTKLIETRILKRKDKKSYLGYSLTKAGLQEMMAIGSIDHKELQIKSNTPLHDITLCEIRWLFSKIANCQLFVTENLIRAKILENDYPDLATFRSLRSDAAALFQINDLQKWFAVEYERSQKSESRYTEKIRKWYQSDDLFSVLVIAENDNLIRQLIKIDSKTLPHKSRKILYISLTQLQVAKTDLSFINCKNNQLNFKVSERVKLQFPVLTQKLATP